VISIERSPLVVVKKATPQLNIRRMPEVSRHAEAREEVRGIRRLAFASINEGMKWMQHEWR